jgi:cobalt/nickel transport system permease protein
MHIPDGFLNAKTAITTGVFSAAGLSASLRYAKGRLQSREVPLIGLTAAFIFVAQMLNFPIASGTSGHLLGATLAAVLLGPSAAIIVMSCVLIIQAFIFADGGVLALGANIFNMGIIAPLCGYAIYRFIRLFLTNRRGQLVAASCASWCTTVIASIFCAAELSWSGTADWKMILPAMAGIHMLIGIGEATITMLVLAAIMKTRPELLNGRKATASTTHKSSFAYAVIFVVLLLVLVAPFASSLPDGLEKIANAFGFLHKAQLEPGVTAPLKEYRIPGLESVDLTTMVAGLIGALSVFALSFLLARALISSDPQKFDRDSIPRQI